MGSKRSAPSRASACSRFPSSVNLKTIDPFQKPEVALPLRLIVGMPNIFPNSTSEFCAERSSAISLKGLGVHVDLAPQPAYDPGLGRNELVQMRGAAAAEDGPEGHSLRVDVEEDRRRVARVLEGMHHVRRRARECLRPACDPLDLGTQPEVDLALEDIEGVGVLPVDVRIRAFLAGLVAKPGHDQLLEFAEDPQRPLGAVGGRFALAWG